MRRQGGTMKKDVLSDCPSPGQLESELKRVEEKHRFRSVLKSTVVTFLTAAALAVLAATLWLPVLQIYGNSMSPTLQNGDILLCVKTSQPEPGDILAFYSGNKLLVKRFLAGPGDQVDIREDGTVFINGLELEEPYLEETALGGADIELPCQVPEGTLFVMGDNRETSVDSRHSILGCVAREQVIGKVIFRLWPLDALGMIRQEGSNGDEA